MHKSDYEKALKSAHAEIGDILKERAALDERLTQLKETVEHLSALLQEPPQFDSTLWGRIADTPDGAGITDAIRQILMESKVPMTPIQVRNALEQSGLNTEYANTMAVVHNTLKRLDKQGELMTVRNPAGQIVAYTTKYQSDSLEGARKKK